jgi:hypothetical protein
MRVGVPLEYQCEEPRSYLDPETLALLKRVYDDALSTLPVSQQTSERRSQIATRILGLAAAGERDSVRLRRAALLPRNNPGVAPRAKAG